MCKHGILFFPEKQQERIRIVIHLHINNTWPPKTRQMFFPENTTHFWNASVQADIFHFLEAIKLAN